MTETYLFYSSLTMLAMAGVALCLSTLFRLRVKRLRSIPRDLGATVFNQTFAVFDPYPQQKKVMHRFLGAMPFIGIAVTFAGIAIVWKMVTAGFLLSTFIMIITLNIIVIEEAPEVYINSKLFIKAVQNKSNFAEGDVKALNLVRKLASKISNYYLGISAILIVTSVALPYVWESLPSLSNWLVASVANLSGLSGTLVFQVVAFLLALSFVIIQLVAFKLKNRIFRCETK